MSVPVHSWVVLNQSQSPAFQQLLDALGARFGRGLLYTGMPHSPAPRFLDIHVGPSYDRSSLWSRGRSWLAFLVGAFVRLLVVKGRPLVLVTTNPPLLPNLAWLARQWRGTPYALLVWDLYPDHLVNTGWAGPRNPLVRLWRALNRRAFLGADVVITIGDALAAALQGQLAESGATRPVAVIANWADTDALRPIPKDGNPFAQAQGQVGKLTVMYSGNLGATHGVSVIAAVAELLRDDPRIGFLVVGDGLGRQQLEADVKSRGLRNVAFAGLQPWEMLTYSLATADIALVTQAEGSAHLSVPSKTYSFLAAGSAILALTARNSDLAALVREHRVGIVEPTGDAAAAAKAIQTLVGDPAALAGMKRRARETALRFFSAGIARERFADALGPAIARGGSAR